MQFVNGFWWDVARGNVRRWPKPSPPFYAVRVARERVTCSRDFFGNRLERRRGPSGHTVFAHTYRPLQVQGEFCVVRHRYNSDCKGYGGPYLHPERVLPSFGVSRKLWHRRALPIPAFARE